MNIDRLLTVTLVLAATAIAGTRIYAVVSPDARVRVIEADGPPTYVESWESALPISRSVGGNPSAPTKIIVLSDYDLS